MRKLTITLSAAALALTAMAMSASAQTQGAAGLNAQIQNATPIKQAACRGFGPYCPPGWTRVCGPWGCRCRPCY